MELKLMESIIEAILFASGDEVPVSAISTALNVEEKTVKNSIERMKDRYDNEKSGMQILRLGDTYQMATRAEYYDYVRKVTEPRKNSNLSGPALETLSIIAYNQPTTKSSVEAIRGVDSSGSINRLVERNLIEEVGRMDTVGKPILYATTTEFLRVFGLSSLDMLPQIDNPFKIATTESETEADPKQENSETTRIEAE